MLKRLVISNYALIDEADISFEDGFSVITGETGAGKSIMLGALSLILGQRNDSSAIKDKERKCVVEANFDIEGYGLEPLFSEEDVDFDMETVIRREIFSGGKSRAFVNDTPVNLSFLKDLSQRLIDIHSQHQTLLLGDYSFQLKVVDAVAENHEVLTCYQTELSKLKSLQKERAKLIELNDKQKADRDYWAFQYNQLHEAALKDGEQAELEQELDQLTHACEIQSALSTASALLLENEISVLDKLRHINTEVGKINRFISGGDELLSRLNSLYIELKDIADDISEKSETIEFDPQRERILQERLDLIYSLQQKHRVDSESALLAIKSDFEEKLSTLDSFDDILLKLDKEIKEQKSIVIQFADQLSQKRKFVSEDIQSGIERQLHDLGMPHAKFCIFQNKADSFRDDGTDEIQFLFTANKNGVLADIPKVASGGEMSRLMLCVKSLLSSAKGLPTIIFDEIDAGVSGEVADKMGRIMKKMGENIQVVSITHLPQIASKGNMHYKVYKTDKEDQTVSEIKQLNNEERILEIAGMLSGAELSEAAMQNARELMQNR